MAEQRGRRPPTLVERDLDARIEAHRDDEERVEILRRARIFKSSWIELGQGLGVVQSLESWRGWGFSSFESYCQKELHLRPETVAKLVATVGFLKARAPEVLESEGGRVPALTLEGVDFWRRAEEASQEREVSEEHRQALRQAVLEQGLPLGTLRRRFRPLFFPPPENEEERARASLLATARRLRQLLQDSRVAPPALSKRLEAELDQLVLALEEPEP
jgi:hypothetical protein